MFFCLSMCSTSCSISYFSFAFHNETNYSSQSLLVSIFVLFTNVECRFEPYFWTKLISQCTWSVKWKSPFRNHRLSYRFPMSLHLYSVHACICQLSGRVHFEIPVWWTGFQCHYVFTQPIQEIFPHTENNDQLQCILYCCIYWCNILCSIAFLEIVSISGNGFPICFFSEAFGNCCDLSSTARLLSRSYSYMWNISSCQTRRLTRMQLP